MNENMYLTRITDKNLKNFENLIINDRIKGLRLPGAGCINGYGEETGVIFVDTDGDGLIIRYLFVDPFFRNEGSGSMLLKAAFDMANAAGLKFIDAFFYDWAPGLEEFFLRNGYLVSRGYPVYTLQLDDLIDSPEFEAYSVESDRFMRISELDGKLRQKPDELIKNSGYSLFDLGYNADLSYVYIDQNGRIGSCIIAAANYPEDTLMIELLINTEQNKMTVVAGLFKTLLESVKDFFSGDLKLEFVCSSNKVFSGAKMFALGSEDLQLKGYVLHASKAV